MFYIEQVRRVKLEFQYGVTHVMTAVVISKLDGVLRRLAFFRAVGCAVSIRVNRSSCPAWRDRP